MNIPVKATVVIFATALAVVALADFELALANHIPGATYNGVHGGGGTVSFRVSASGSGVEHFELHDCPCGPFLITNIADFDPPTPIDESHNFSYSGIGIQRLSFTGSFPSADAAQGTVRYQQTNIPFVQPGCDSGTLNWSATIDSPVPGDYNSDGLIDAADYTAWRDNVGAPPGTLSNDTDGGVIGQAQYETWKTNFSQTLGAGSSAHTTVPEPTALVLIAAALAALHLRHRTEKGFQEH